jgi:hypothetical protein
MGKYILFCDESGNTGTNFLDEKQPYFTLAGWLIKEENIINSNNYIDNLAIKNQIKELKSSNLMKNMKGISIIQDVCFELAFAYSAIPYFVCMDKKFMVASKVVETFFDPEYNPYTNYLMTTPVEVKKALATCICEDNIIVRKFAKIIFDGTSTIDDFKSINQCLVELFKNQNHKSVVHVLENLNNSNFQKMIDEYSYISKNGNKKSGLSLSMTALYSILLKVEVFGQLTKTYTDVIHDELFGYQSDFGDFSSLLFKNTTPAQVGNWDKYMLSNFQTVKNLSMGISKNIRLLQAADILAGYLGRQLEKVFNNKIEGYSKEFEILNQLIGLEFEMNSMQLRISDYCVPYQSNDYMYNYIRSIIGERSKMVTDFHIIIESEFDKCKK